jgi:M6 family metalloprotease-like protein
MKFIRTIVFLGAVLALSACGSNDGSSRDTTAPVISLQGDNPQIIAVDEAYVELGATAMDNRDGVLSASIAIDASAIDSSTPGQYTVTYNVSDAAGNAATTVNRTVTYEDRTPPVITSSDFSHFDTPHVMSKNSFALPTQLDQLFAVEETSGSVPLMLILLEFPDSQHDAVHTPAFFEDLVFGNEPSVNGYFDEISYGQFSFENAGVTDWVTAPAAASYYFDSTQADNQYTTLGAVAVQAAIDAGVDFDPYDLNSDGKVSRDELLILVPLADHPPRALPYVMASRFDQRVTQGVSTPTGIEVDTLVTRVEENPNRDDRRVYITFYAHEISHMALALPDLYGDDFGEDDAGPFSLMSLAYTTFTPHISPWSKIHLGWITPEVVEGCGDIQIDAVESTPQVHVIFSEVRGVDEYFIVENRWPAASAYSSHADDFEFLDRGLAVWHITEYYDEEPFNFLKGRKMIGMKWAGGSSSFATDPYSALFDCSEASSCYDLNDVSTPRDSRWQDGNLSGIEITAISEAGQTMTFSVNRTSGC